MTSSHWRHSVGQLSTNLRRDCHGGPSYLRAFARDERRKGDSGTMRYIVLALEVARHAVGRMRAGGTLLFIGGTGGSRIGRGSGIVSAATATSALYRCPRT